MNIGIQLHKVRTYGPSMLPSKESNESGSETDRKCANKISPSLSSGPIYVQEVDYGFIIRKLYIHPVLQISVVSTIRNNKDQCPNGTYLSIPAEHIPFLAVGLDDRSTTPQAELRREEFNFKFFSTMIFALQGALLGIRCGQAKRVRSLCIRPWT